MDYVRAREIVDEGVHIGPCTIHQILPEASVRAEGVVVLNGDRVASVANLSIPVIAPKAQVGA